MSRLQVIEIPTMETNIPPGLAFCFNYITAGLVQCVAAIKVDDGFTIGEGWGSNIFDAAAAAIYDHNENNGDNGQESHV
jgi:hypothetical protein